LLRRTTGILIGVIGVVAALSAYMVAAYPTTLYENDIVLTLGYTSQDIPISVNWPKTQVRVTLNVHQSFAVWNVTIYDAANHVVWTHSSSGATSQIIISSDWQPLSGDGVVRVRPLGHFNATVTVEAKGQPW
jgi:hypothetical protein